MSAKKYLIVVAGGSGTRMGAAVPKQFLLFAGRPILAHTLQVFYDYDPALEIVVALPAEHFEMWHNLKKAHQITVPHTLVVGGQTRTQSVMNALQNLQGEGLVAVHDAVRPLVSPATIARCFEQAAKTGACIPVMPLTESIRRITNHSTAAENRENFRTVQTPQVFDLQALKKSYAAAKNALYTDDASVVEASGHTISTTSGNEENIKITTPFDLKIAEALQK